MVIIEVVKGLVDMARQMHKGTKNANEEHLLMIKGNINRLEICDNFDELDDMYRWAIHRLRRIYEYNRARIELLLENQEDTTNGKNKPTKTTNN